MTGRRTICQLTDSHPSAFMAIRVIWASTSTSKIIFPILLIYFEAKTSNTIAELGRKYKKKSREAP